MSSLKELRAEAIPANLFGYLLVAPSAGTVTPPGSFGTLCLAGGVGRYVDQIRQADASGSRQFSVLPNAIPTPPGPHVTQWGETSNFQTWYRDTLGAQVESNFTSALSVAFE